VPAATATPARNKVPVAVAAVVPVVVVPVVAAAVPVARAAPSTRPVRTP
jgi:hypothetical protein